MDCNTTVIVYGTTEENRKRIEENFEWRFILAKCTSLFGATSNPEIFIREKEFTISCHDKYICVHPADLDTIKKMKEILTEAVSEYYNCDCYIEGDYAQFTVRIRLKEDIVSGEIMVGDRIEFGRCKQDTDADTLPVYWKVLDVSDTTALLIAEDCLMTSAYCDPQKAWGNDWYLMWGNCLAREMCNGVFYHKAFTNQEKYVIEPKKMTEAVNGPICLDPVFLLSEGEVVILMGDPQNRKAKPSLVIQTEKMQSGSKAYHEKEGYTFWWLLPEERSNGGIYPKCVRPNGQIHYHGREIISVGYTIRPCIRINLKRYKKYLEMNHGSRNAQVLSYFAKPKTPDVPKAMQDTQEKKTKEYPKISGGSAYSLAYIKGYSGEEKENHPGARSAGYDASTKTWRLRIQLDSAGIWFLSVFVRYDGIFKEFSLDRETANDSHYVFRDEKGLRKSIYAPGDENKYLAEILIRYVKTYGGDSLATALGPFVTAVYHYD